VERRGQRCGQRLGRASLPPWPHARPPARRSQGVSQAQFFSQYLGNIALNTAPVDWSAEDLTYLEQVRTPAVMGLGGR
jgi:hypothetical protein